MRLNMILFAIALIVLFSGCGREKASDDRSEIEALINGTYSSLFEGGDVTGSEEPGTNTINATQDTATQPAHWWRTVSTWNRIITIDFPSEGHADVSVEDTVNGILYVDRSFDGQLNPGQRSWVNKHYQYASFEKTGSNWYLTGISIGQWEGNDPNTQKVFITSFRIQGSSFDKTYTDPTVVIPLSELPVFSESSTITVTMVTTNNSSSILIPKTFGYLHHPVLIREPMDEDPTNTFTHAFTVMGTNWRLVSGDAVDSTTLQTESGTDYNWMAWVLPFKVQ